MKWFKQLRAYALSALLLMNNTTLTTNSFQDLFSTTFLLGNIGAPFVIGMSVGYFAKKMVRLALFLGGAAVVLLFVSEYYGVVDISDTDLQHAADTATHAAISSGEFLQKRLSSITSKGVSAAAGFFAGFKMG